MKQIFNVPSKTDGYRHNYWGMRGTRTPFLDWGTVPPTFQDEKVKNLLLFDVNRGDLCTLNYTKAVFGLGSAPDPIERAQTLSQTQE